MLGFVFVVSRATASATTPFAHSFQDAENRGKFSSFQNELFETKKQSGN